MSSAGVCMFYLRGACRFGNKCWNSHDVTGCRTREFQALAAAATATYYEERYPQTTPSTSATDISTQKVQPDISTQKVQPQGLQLLLEASMKPKLKQPDESDVELEKAANELSVAMKSGDGKSVKESASKLHTLHQQKMKDNENNHSAWSDFIQCAIDSDLQCNICFELFIKPTVLNCSHTFCETCIHVWTNRSRKCPICRVQIRSKSYCLTLDSFIEKIVEHLPKEFKYKRSLALKERSKIKIDKPRVNHRLQTRDLATLISFEEIMEADTPLQYITVDQHEDISPDVIIEESEMFRMNLHDTVVSTGGINPLMSYIVVPDEQHSNRPITRPNNSSIRH
ncbi:E3 ubiquitin-protein ligase rnf8-B-like [Rhopalosiphum padi]|uniref:E3 ubiquitin-protein ligase rnf8-B-like n=1 Tax=Rhopalosiphum padi TaxID=40932 RepID=UPI00298E1362|nr:E3 ubiquitin-protein ligase rnf8-B-like [Rhopalosiphum padi]